MSGLVRKKALQVAHGEPGAGAEAEAEVPA